MERNLPIEKFGINIIDEITNFLSAKEIASLFGVNQYFHKLWSSRISQKIFRTMPNFTIEIGPRERWLYHQMRMMCFNENYPKRINITSSHSIYFLESSLNPLPELKLILDGQIVFWRPESENQKIIKCSNLVHIEFAIHAYAYESEYLALMLTNNRMKHIYKNEEISDLEIREFDFYTVSKMFYLPKANFLVLCFSDQIIYMINNGEIISNRKLGAIQKYKTLPWKNDSFVAIINDKFYLIEPYSIKLLCECSKSVNDLPEFWADKETEKLIIYTRKKKSGWRNKVWPFWIEFIPLDIKVFEIQNHMFFMTNRTYRLTDSCCNHQYEFEDEIQNILIDGNYILILYIDRVLGEYGFALFIVGESKAIIRKKIYISIKVLNFSYPYIFYSTISSTGGLAEVGLFKF